MFLKHMFGTGNSLNMTKTDWAEKNGLPSCPGQPNFT